MNLKQLRQRFPEEGWVAVSDGFGWGYQNDAGDTAHWVSSLAPSYPDDDNTFQSQFYVYRRGKSPELLCNGNTYRGG